MIRKRICGVLKERSDTRFDARFDVHMTQRIGYGYDLEKSHLSHCYPDCLRQQNEDGLWASPSWDLQKLRALSPLDDETITEAPCAFCRLLASVIDWSEVAREFEHGTVSVGPYMSRTPDNGEMEHGWAPTARNVTIRGNQLCVVKGMRIRLPWDILPMFPASTTVASSLVEEEDSGEGVRMQQSNTLFERLYPRHARPVDKRLIDLSLVKRWIEWCDISHGNSCQRLPLRRRGEPAKFRFRLIDVDDGCIVNTDLNYEYECEYLALSYVLGSTNTQPMLNQSTCGPWSQPSALFGSSWQLPDTIKDAIALTRLLGQR
jgi:hypothetical protein